MGSPRTPRFPQPHLPPGPSIACLAPVADQIHCAHEILLPEVNQLHAQSLWLHLTLVDSPKQDKILQGMGLTLAWLGKSWMTQFIVQGR